MKRDSGTRCLVLPAAWDPVELALARALDRASEAGRFDVVVQIAGELRARRVARMGNVVRRSWCGSRAIRGRRPP